MIYSNNKHYYSLSEYYKNKYNKKIAKVALNANFTCPNKDGSKGFGGCSYCSSLGSGDMAGDINKSLKEQFFDIAKIMDNKWPNCYYIPYLQANSNTYKPLKDLKNIYEDILNFSNKIVSLAIATRSDCLDFEKIEYLGELNKKIPIQIELGLQTISETTAKKINRCSTIEDFILKVKLLRAKNIEVVVHIINGLPYETKEMMIDNIKFLNNLDIQGIKIHSLLILKNTKLYLDYLNENFKILSLEEYVDIICDQIGFLNENIVIHRLAADASFDTLVTPLWTRKKFVVMNEIDKELRKRNIFQGDYLK